MLPTDEVFHDPMGWLKDLASSNIDAIVVTLEVFQVPIFRLKDLASLNI